MKRFLIAVLFLGLPVAAASAAPTLTFNAIKNDGVNIAAVTFGSCPFSVAAGTSCVLGANDPEALIGSTAWDAFFTITGEPSGTKNGDVTGTDMLSGSPGDYTHTFVGSTTDVDFGDGMEAIVTLGDFTSSSLSAGLPFSFAYVAIPTSAPEPITLSIFGAGLAGAAAMRRRKAKV